MRTFRVIVRGRFEGLSSEVKSQLLAKADSHDALDAAFTEDGTFTYDKALNAFTFRYLMNDNATDRKIAAGNAETAAELAATDYLEERSIGYRDLRLESINMDEIAANTRRLQSK